MARTPSETTSMRIFGVIALACLIACLWLSLRMVGVGAADFDAEHDWTKTWLALPTVIYFVSGTLYYRLLRKES